LWPSDYISVNNASAAKWYLHDFGRMRRARSWPGWACPRAYDARNSSRHVAGTWFRGPRRRGAHHPGSERPWV